MNFPNFSTHSGSSKQEIESIFNKILSPIKKELDPNLVGQFCLKINSDLDGPQFAVDLLIPKLQSTQEWESLIALYVLEACVKNCGERFHELIGRFRFLNEMIKIVSPKYLGNKMSDKVKQRCIEILYSWSEGLKDKTKIKEAYDMLKRQKIIESDPTNVDQLVINPPPPRPKDPIFDDEEKSKQLARLLKSKNPQDLELANSLIKSMVKQEEIKTEKISNRINELEHINNNIKLLNDMLSNFNTKTATESEKETIKYLYDELEKLRPNLIQLATDTDDNDDAIGDILKTNDQCEKIIKQYKLIFLDQIVNGSDLLVLKNPTTKTNSTNQLDDVKLVNLSMGPSTHEEESVQPNEKYDPLKELQDLFSTPDHIESKKLDNFEDILNLNNEYTNINTVTNNIENLFSSININTQTQSKPLMPSLISSSNNMNTINNNYIMPKHLVSQKQEIKTPQIKALEDLNQLGKNLMEKSLSDPKTPLNAGLIDPKKTTTNESETEKDLFDTLNNLFVPLETIKPNTQIAPFELYNKNNLKIVIHFGLTNNQYINVCVLSVTSYNLNQSLKNFNFQAAVPKSMKIKLQPASRTDLPVYNPILPPTAITQVMLVANSNKEQIRLKYRLNYAFDDMQYNELDEVKTLPNLN